MTMPGEQKPHWLAPVATNASAQAERDSSGSPSRVVTARPATRSPSRAQETTGRPSTSTVHAPQVPSGAQPSFIERSPKPSRSTSRRLVPGSTSIETGRPFRMKSIVRPQSCRRGPTGPSDDPAVDRILAAHARRGWCRPARNRAPGPARRRIRAVWAASPAPEERRMTAVPGSQPADRTAYERTVQRYRETRTVLPTFAQLIDPETIPAAARAGARRRGSRRAGPPEPLPRPLAQRGRPAGHRRRPRARGPAVELHRGRGADRRRPRRPLPDDRRPQGARRLRLPRPAPRHRGVRPHDPARRLAVRPATTAGAAWPSRGSSAAAAWPSSPRG